ncbi:uncharacterized protein LTR77_011127 [Saxophila tyrrhenica]|uniref:Zn(2)-C6 fungal-type domain-containing protein n=1 Tax=Saxophila tyrrhenica TaxID=1690608 RepID=A0AAV9NV49_9PEZI|nr:hypothetical protein LTR77_011127 [Saxophila tyrrhenica]
MDETGPTPPSERKVACNVCRRRKTACDRARPKCSLCTKNGLVCHYADKERHTPGLRAGYVQSLEQRIDGLESRLQRLESRVPTDGVTDPMQDATNSDGPEHVHHFYADGRPSTQGSGYFAGPTERLEGASNHDEHSFNLDHIGDPSPQNTGTPTDPLAFPVVQELCTVWFQKYHRWLPILHRPTFMQTLESAERVRLSNYAPVVEAIVAITLPHSNVISASALHQEHLRNQLSSSVVLQCIDRQSAQSAQALLILSVFHYGEGNFTRSWNMLAMARRISVHLGLTAPGDSGTASSPTALRRLADFTNTTVTQEERTRAYWMSQMLESISTVGAPYELALSATPGHPLLPCSDTFWDFPDEVMSEHQIRPYNYCSAFSLCVILAASELSVVHQFLRRAVNMEAFEERDAWQIEAQRIDERLTAWRDEFVAAVFRLINAEYASRERPEMDAYVVLTNCVLNTAVITLLQRRAACPEGTDQTVEPWAFANTRCVYAAENTAFKIRQMDEDELLVCHPHLIFSIFVAARFYIVHSKALDASVPTNLHCLAFALHTCGKTWPLACYYEKILRIAVAEYRTPVVLASLPRVFYDLRQTTFEIVDTLIEWVKGPGVDAGAAMPAASGHNGSMIFTPMTTNPLT